VAQNPEKKPGQKGPKSMLPGGFNKIIMISVIAVLLVSIFMLFNDQLANNGKTSPGQMMMDVNSGAATSIKVEVSGSMATIRYQASVDGAQTEKLVKIPYGEIGNYFTPELTERLGDNFEFINQPSSMVDIVGTLFNVFLIIALVAMFIFFFKNMQGGGGKALSFGKSKAKKYIDNDNKVRFSDVAGQEEAKYELQEVVDFLKNPDRYHKIGARIPRGVLLVGMPGTGKTLLARAVAGEAEVAFFHMSGSDFVEMFVGVGASRVRDLFEQGRKNSPCIIFIDELDAVGRTRGAGYGGGHDEREQTLNQMLVEMDGFDVSDNVILLAATNRPDVLDPALLRPGRFDRQVVVDLPDVKEREAILKIHSKKIKLTSTVDLSIIAKATPGSSGADIANLVNEAALFSVRKKRKKVSMEDFEEARDKLLMGVARKSKIISPEEKLATAYHESGHALLHYYLKHIDPLHKVTVIPRGRAAGVTFSLPENDNAFYNTSNLLDRIKLFMGGYVAEEIIYGETTNGTQNDIKQATGIARKMVMEWGMSSLGFVSFGQEDEPIFIGREITQVKDYSEETSKQIDFEVKKIIDECMADTKKILTKYKDQLEILAKELVDKETLDDNEVRTLLNLPLVEKSTTIVDRSAKSKK